MLLMLSWIDGEMPYVDVLPPQDWITAVVTLVSAVVAGRSVRLYWAANDGLTLVYPTAERADIVESTLIEK